MDKGKWKSVSVPAVTALWKKRLFAAGKTAAAVLAAIGAFGGLFSLAKSGSPLFYYAVAFASPGSVLDLWSEEASLVEQDEILLPETPTEEPGPEAVPDRSEPEKPVPEVPEKDRGKVTEVQYKGKSGGIYIPYQNACVKNCTKLSTEKVLAMLETPTNLSLSTALGETPQVLLYHTHATEAFEPADRGYFDVNGTWRSTDYSENMTAVGDEVADVLTENGIGVLHDYTLHDDPSYKGSYQRSAVTVSGWLSEYPSLTVCLDLHRDAIEPSEREIIKPTALIDGKKAAQIMIIAGCDDGTMNMPNYPENLRFAVALADRMETLYPGLCRPILFDYRKYNMDLSPGLLLIEIGATGNTLEEAKYSARLLGNALVSLLTA